MAITFYSKGLVETTVIRRHLLFYLTPIWSTIFGIIWLSEKLTFGRVANYNFYNWSFTTLSVVSQEQTSKYWRFYGLMSEYFGG